MSGLGDRKGFSAVAYSVLVLSGWLAANVLLAVGVLWGFFLMFANGSAIGFFEEAANLSNHFVAADLVEQRKFIDLVRVVFAFVAVFFCIVRFGVVMALFADLRAAWVGRGVVSGVK